MGMLQKLGEAFAAKALQKRDLRFPGRTFVWFDWLDRRSIHEIENEIGDGTTSGVLMTTLHWIQRAAVEAPLVALDDEGNPVEDSELQGLLDNPNPFYGPDHLIAGAVYDLSVTGNAYWMCVRDGNQEIAELWWIPSAAVEPKWPDEPTPEDRRTGRAYISHYQYNADGVIERVDPGDLIHFRQGVDPRNIRKGLSPLRGLLREIWTDAEAADFTASLLRNGGVPGLVLSPTNPEVRLTQEEAEAAKAKIDTDFSRSNRGKPIVMLGPTQITQFGFSPQQMDLSVLRDVSEERVTAALGVPAAVVGFGAGLQTSKVGATMRELVKLAHHNAVIPLQGIIAAGVNQRLVPKFDGVESVDFDLDQVEALQEDRDSKALRLERMVRAGILTRGEARTELGFEAEDADDVFLLPLSTIEVPREGLPEPNGNGNPEQQLDAEVEEDEDAEERQLILPAEAKHDGSLLERLVIERSPSAHPTPAMLRFARAHDQIRREEPERMAAVLSRLFERMGEAAERAALDVLGESGELERRSARLPETKQSDRDLEVAILSAIAEFEDELASALGSEYLRIAREIAKRLKSVMGIEFVITDRVQVEILRQGGLRVGLIDLTQQTRDALFDALAEARAEGLAGENLARRIREHISAGPWRDVATRARVIARTEGAHAANTATLMAAREMPETEHVMVFDDRIGFSETEEGEDHEVCAEIDGKIITIQQADAIGLAHPNCLPGSAVVIAPNLHATFTRWFDGELVVLRTADDQLFSCTSNHPVLSDQGWVSAKSLREGDHVVCCLDPERVATILDPDNDHAPTRVEDVAGAFGMAPGVTTRCMPGAAEDFHGDGIKGHVTVVRTDGFLERSAVEQLPHAAVVGADVELPTFDGESPPALLLERMLATAHGLMGSSGDAPSLGRGVAGHVETLCLGGGSHLEATNLEVSGDRWSAHATHLGESGHALTGLIEAVQIVEVSRRNFSGQVYNLETSQGWFIADGIITHNCTRSFTPVNSLLLEELLEQGREVVEP